MVGGDLIFCRSPRFTSRFIRAVAGGSFSHVAVAVSETEIVEATARGVLKRPISEWPPDVSYVCHTPIVDEEDRRDAVERALYIAGESWSYNWISFFGMALYWFTGGSLAISAGAKAAICSALTADVMHAAGEYFPKHSLFMTPKDLQTHYGVTDA